MKSWIRIGSLHHRPSEREGVTACGLVEDHDPIHVFVIEHSDDVPSPRCFMCWGANPRVAAPELPEDGGLARDATLRDLFAAFAAAGSSIHTAGGCWVEPAGVARRAYAVADALLAERERER